jgi:hypothetical protein
MQVKVIKQLLPSGEESGKMGMPIVLMPIDELRPHEKGLPIYLEILKQEILRDGMIKYPLIADENTHVILDGMHRWLALKSLGYSLIPCMLVRSDQKRQIRVGKRRIDQYKLDATQGITVDDVISAGLSGNLLKPRSTRHFFPFSKYRKVNCPLNLLRRRSPQGVSAYLASTSKKESYLAVKEWLEELSEELEFLEKRKSEVEREKEDFQKRISNFADLSRYSVPSNG